MPSENLCAAQENSPTSVCDWPARFDQLELLRGALFHARRSSVYAWGGPAVGKRTVVEAAIPAGFSMRTVDCVLAYGDAALLRACAPDAAPGDLHSLVRALDAEAGRGESVALVLLRAERLAASHFRPGTLKGILELARFVKHPEMLRVVFVSRVPWGALRHRQGLDGVAPLCVLFPAYTEEELVCAVMDVSARRSESAEDSRVDVSEKIWKDLYPDFVRAVVGVLFTSTTDLRELVRVCVALYPKYLQPLADDTRTPPESLWSRFHSHIAEANRMLYRRELEIELPPRTTDHDYDGSIEEDPDITEAVEEDLVPVGRPVVDNTAAAAAKTVAEMDLGRQARMLLLAVFLGAYNPPKKDLHYFSTETTRERRAGSRKPSLKSTLKKRGRTRASVAVPLNRIIAIFDSLQCAGSEMATVTGGQATTTKMATNAFINLSSLVTLSLLSRDATGDLISDPKFRCNISLETAQAISNTIGVKLSEYLHVDARQD